ncbi:MULTISPECIES: hypothetical protein [unclassified Chelatococcus]|uniref:hypothetical protein n=1 Tax=unclassified Chelatococcus TaxID=2638111 RepID=UPI001BCA6E76|nr:MULTISPECIES: hypothetical protein [unclassified Chelatococcus]MBS7700304.1 hypothetical protein [Chelatococcus sp. YT9]MBX3558275.1 hypothetical protein [Chelatococcus sp.]
MPSEEYPRPVRAELPAGAGPAAVGAVVADFGRSIAATQLQDNVAVVTRAMGADLQAILAAFTQHGSSFAMAPYKTITEKSSTSLALTPRRLRLGRAAHR